MGFHEMPSTLLTLLAVLLAAADAVSASDRAKPSCQSTCGNLTIPFPFGTKPGCYLEDETNSFYVTCINDSQLYKGESTHNIGIRNISLDGKMIISAFIARACFDEFGVPQKDNVYDAFLKLAKFFISYRRNKFTAVGCNTEALIQGTRGHDYTTGCISLCNNLDGVKNGSCSGIACCQSSIPEGVKDFRATITNKKEGNNSLLKVHPCSYAFLVEENAYNFSSLNLTDLQGRDRVPVVLDWAVGYETCEEAKKNQSSYACTALNSDCIPSTNGPGYRCNCSSGYEGNPYLADGCKDINECLPTTNPCDAKAACENVNGSVSCACPDGYC